MMRQALLHPAGQPDRELRLDVNPVFPAVLEPVSDPPALHAPRALAGVVARDLERAGPSKVSPSESAGASEPASSASVASPEASLPAFVSPPQATAISNMQATAVGRTAPAMLSSMTSLIGSPRRIFSTVG